MKRTRIFTAILALLAILTIAGTAYPASKKAAPQTSTITFNGTLALSVNGRSSNVRGKSTVNMPTTFRIETQDDYPTVLAQLLEDGGYTKRRADVTVRTSKSFTLTGSRILGIYQIRRGKDGNRLEAIKGSSIPANTGDYYVGIKLTRQEEREIEDVGILRYFKLHVDEVKPAKKR